MTVNPSGMMAWQIHVGTNAKAMVPSSYSYRMNSIDVHAMVRQMALDASAVNTAAARCAGGG